MDKRLWIGLPRLIDEGSAEELQGRKQDLLEALEACASDAGRCAAMSCAWFA